MKPSLCLIYILLFFSTFINAQKLEFIHLTNANGLSGNIVNTIVQDSLGFIWIGTENGLNRFDGRNVKTYFNVVGDSNSLAGNVVYRLMLDGKKRLWVCTNGGADIYRPETDNFCHIPVIERNGTQINILKKYYVPAGAIDQTGNPYFSQGRENILFYNENKKVLEPIVFNAQSGYETGNVVTMFFDKKNQLWFGSQTMGLFCANIATKKLRWFKNTGLPNQIASNIVFSVGEDKAGRIFIGTNHGLNIYYPATDRFELIGQTAAAKINLKSVKVWSIRPD